MTANPAPETFSPEIDLYIAKAKPFAQPILAHLRALVHKAIPGVTETLKWSRPFFEYKGQIVANLSGFNAHCNFGFWGQEIGILLKEANLIQDGGMGSFGRITTLNDLPSDKQILSFLKQSKTFIDAGTHTSPIAARNRVVKAPKPKLAIPTEFVTALKSNQQASAAFHSFAPSCQREYSEWISEAKRPETRQKRIAQSIEWLSQGKQRHWKYQPPAPTPEPI